MHRLLIVDDEDSFREFVEMALNIEGYSVFAAGNGQEALTVLQSVHLDLIILDLCMPCVNGWDVLACARRETVNRHTPVLVLTALADAETRRRSMQERIKKLLVKPVSVDEIIDAIESALVSV